MAEKPNLLIIGDYNRKDYLDVFIDCKDHFNFYFIEFSSPKEILNDLHTDYGKAIFWGDFRSAFDLIEKIGPHKVIFFYLESYFHVALNIACKINAIKTYHLEHGLRDLNINVRLEHHVIIKIPPNRISFLYKIFSQFNSRLQARLFLINTIKELPETEASLLKDFIKVRKNNIYIETLKKANISILTTDAFLSYSPKVYAVHKYYQKLSASYCVHYIGIPLYDHLSKIKTNYKLGKSIIYLDRGLSNRNLFGWNKENYNKFLNKLLEITANYNFKLLIKTHPSNIDFDYTLHKHLGNYSIIDDNELAQELPFTKLIIGFFSTYLLPLAAMQHTTLLTLENHPAGRLDVSKSFIDAGVAHPIYDLEELNTILPNIEQLHQQQLPNKAKFTEEWMYKFDGKAGERLRDILLSDDL